MGAPELLKTQACSAALGSGADSADPITQQSSRTEKPVDPMGHVFPPTPIPAETGTAVLPDRIFPGIFLQFPSLFQDKTPTSNCVRDPDMVSLVRLMSAKYGHHQSL